MPHQVYENSKGEKLPSVTTVLGIINKPALIAWANKIGLEGIKYYDELRRTARLGSLVHSICEFYTSKTPIEWNEYSKEEIIKSCTVSKRYFEWVSYQNQFKPILSEAPLISEKYQYGGCIDLLCMLNGKVTLLDYKTSSGIHDTMISQVSAYKQLLEENGHKVEQCVILRIGRDDKEGFEYREITEKELKQGFKVFKSALNLHNEKKKFDKLQKEIEVNNG